MKRSAVALLVVALGSGTVPPADAQQAGRVYRIGYLSASRPPGGPAFQGFQQTLRELGWEEGRNVAFERRFAEGHFERLPALAEELVKLKVDVILAPSTPSVLAARRATSTIPIVIPMSGDPVALGLVASLPRPGGNVTGINSLVADVGVKHLELLKETLPRMSRVGILYNPDYPGVVTGVRHTSNAIAAQQLGVSLHPAEVRAPSDINPAFAALGRDRVEGLVVYADPVTLAARNRIVELAAARRLPAIYGLREFVEAGGLMAYGPSLPAMFRRAAVYVDKILRGAPPGDLPMEQPTTFELPVNLRAARALGLTIPPSVLVRAEVIP